MGTDTNTMKTPETCGGCHAGPRRDQGGVGQASDYEEAIHNVFETLRTYPEFGKIRDDLLPSLRC